MSIIAVLDDGICEEFLAYPCVYEHLTVSNGEVIADREKPANLLTHGTRCVGVITEELPSVSIVSIRLMDFGENASIDNLICALKWCAEHLPSIVHMSLGSVLYDDGQRLLPYIQALTDAGVLIVSAFNNFEIPTWPACCPGVFGVRSDKSALMQEGEFIFDSKYRGFPENSIIAHCRAKTHAGKTSYASMSNSFAAPIITARLYAWLQGGSKVTLSDAMEYLRSISVKNITDAPKFCDLRRFERKKLEIPSIWVSASLLTEISEKFREQGYNVFECSDFGEGIPLDLYADNGVITKNLLQMVETIYYPDIIIMGTAGPAREHELFDLQLSVREQKIWIEADEESWSCNSAEDAFFIIQGFFD
ncbi:MAG: hypothetical protein HDT20_02115 [Oscillibacter sp.]|nr:hypothetical protein [Oscillibacter sp.]